jgi:hypothetical protein
MTHFSLFMLCFELKINSVMPFKQVKCQNVFPLPSHLQPTTKLSRFKKFEFHENRFQIGQKYFLRFGRLWSSKVDKKDEMSQNFRQFSDLKPTVTRAVQKLMFGRTKLNSDLFSWGRAHSFLCCVQTGNRASNYRLAMRICDFFRW